QANPNDPASSVGAKSLLLFNEERYAYVAPTELGCRFDFCIYKYSAPTELCAFLYFRMNKPYVSVVIAALNEEAAIGKVINDVPRKIADEIIVVDNGSTDRTAEVAEAAGARVVAEPRRGYGRTFRAGLRAVAPECEIVVFLDGDGSDYPEMMGRLVDPIFEGTHDFVISSRTRGKREAGSMNWNEVFAGSLVGFFLRLLYGVRSTDMGPFRAIRRDALARLKM